MAGQFPSAVESERPFRLAFGSLLMIVLGIRVLSALEVRRAGERLLPDRAARVPVPKPLRWTGFSLGLFSLLS